VRAHLRFLAVFAFALVPLATMLAFPQAPQVPRAAVPTGTGAIGGVVTSPTGSGEERPVRRAIVRLSSADLRGSREAATDDLGRFVFTELPAGRFTLTATKPGYLAMAYGAKRFQGAGTPVTLAAAQRELGLKMSLPRGGVITGTIRDAAGRPIANAGVDVLQRTTAAGVVTLTRSGGDVTDDRGAYRVFGLPAGTFIVVVNGADQLNVAARQTTAAELEWALQPRPAGSAGVASPPPASPLVALSPVYYPGTVDVRSATPVSIDFGQERGGVDVAIQFVPMVRVSGTLMRPDGRSAGGMSLSLQPESPAGFAFTILPRLLRASATVSASGDFDFTSVAPGRYSLTARLGTPDGTLWLKESVDVAGQDVSGLAFAMKPAVNVSGRVVIAPDASNPAPSVTGLRVSLSSASVGGLGSSVMTSPAADGTFSLEGVIPGSYVVAASIPARGLAASGPVWSVGSAVIAGRDVFDRYFEIPAGGTGGDIVITLTDKVASLSGKLMDGTGSAAPEFFVLLIPVDRSLWMPKLARSPRTVRPGNDGVFRFDNVAPGDYYVAGSTDVDPPLLFDAEYLEQFLPVAITLTIAAGEPKVQDLKIGGWPWQG